MQRGQMDDGFRQNREAITDPVNANSKHARLRGI